MTFPKTSQYPVQIDEKTTFSFTCHHFISKQETPELLDKLASGELFHVTNPKTNEVAPILYPCVYLDAEKKFVILFNPNGALSADQVSTDQFEGLEGDFSAYDLRVTTSLPDFFEKINTLDFGQSDTEMEAVKILTHALLSEQDDSFKSTRLSFFEIEGQPVFIVWAQDGSHQFTEYKKELVKTVHDRLGQQLQVDKGVFQAIDSNWAIDALGLR